MPRIQYLVLFWLSNLSWQTEKNSFPQTSSVHMEEKVKKVVGEGGKGSLGFFWAWVHSWQFSSVYYLLYNIIGRDIPLSSVVVIGVLFGRDSVSLGQIHHSANWCFPQSLDSKLLMSKQNQELYTLSLSVDFITSWFLSHCYVFEVLFISSYIF